MSTRDDEERIQTIVHRKPQPTSRILVVVSARKTKSVKQLVATVN